MILEKNEYLTVLFRQVRIAVVMYGEYSVNNHKIELMHDDKIKKVRYKN